MDEPDSHPEEWSLFKHLTGTRPIPFVRAAAHPASPPRRTQEQLDNVPAAVDLYRAIKQLPPSRERKRKAPRNVKPAVSIGDGEIISLLDEDEDAPRGREVVDSSTSVVILDDSDADELEETSDKKYPSVAEDEDAGKRGAEAEPPHDSNNT
ncbi:hypothetical protein HK104_005230, partial [Borealophlyctis nickersoniae]